MSLGILGSQSILSTLEGQSTSASRLLEVEIHNDLPISSDSAESQMLATMPELLKAQTEALAAQTKATMPQASLH